MPKRRLIGCLGKLYPVAKPYQKFIEQTELFSRKTIKKNMPLLLHGRHAEELHFVDQGAFKMYLVDEDNEEQIIDFFAENTFIVLPERLLEASQEQPVYIVAIENSQLLSCAKKELGRHAVQFPEIKHHLDGISKGIASRQMKHMAMLFLAPCERYAVFVREFNDICLRLSASNISRFLGISPKTLQRSKKAFRLMNRPR